MNYEEDDALRAPVWDELNTDSINIHKTNNVKSTITNTGLNHNNDENSTMSENLLFSTGSSDIRAGITEELSDTFANIGTVGINERSYSPHDEELGQEDDDEHKLLETLAPETDPLANLQIENIDINIMKGRNEPLFGESSIVSPILGGTILNINSKSSGDSSNIKLGKPHLLFNATTRLRRRKPDFGSESKTVGTVVGNDDPLGKVQKENEFIEESLDDEFSHITKSGSTTSILDKIDEPLYNISPRKSNKPIVENKVLHAPDDKISDEETKENELIVDVIPFLVEVKDPIKVGELTSAHIEYTVVAESDLITNRYSQVTRRYRDFRWLYRQLQSNYWGKVIPPPPEKQAVGRFQRDLIENRKFQMDNMLKRIVSDPQLQKDVDFILFLTSEDFSNDSKVREHRTGSGAYNDSNDLAEIHISEIELLGSHDAIQVLKNGGIDGELNKGFMSFSLSTQPKYNERDPYFIEESDKFSILEEQLKQLYKSLELVDTERNELGVTIGECSKAIGALAKLEVTRKSSDLLMNFTEIHIAIKDSLERSSLQQSLTLGVTLDEYVRSLSSVKAIFNQRAKLGYFLVITENDLNKKKAQFNKSYPDFKKSEHLDDDKCKNLMNECNVIEERVQKIKGKWDTIGENIKRETKSYKLEKINEFRNSMEILLESSIESQKECIELWETFYQNNL